MADAQSDSGGFGYGQQEPFASNHETNLWAFQTRQLMAQMDTMKLVKVMAVTAAEGDGDVKAAGTVDVLPLVNQIDGNANQVPHGTVYKIPWARSQGGTNAVVCDPVVGDIGYVIAADRDISAVKTTKKQSNPGSLRRFDIADGIYAGAALNVAPTQYLVFTEAGIRLVDKSKNSIVMDDTGITVTDATGNVLKTSSTGIDLTPKAGLPVTVNGMLVVKGAMQISGAIETVGGGVYTGNLHTAGNIIAGFGTGDQVGLTTHTHTQPNDSHGDTEQPTAAPTAGT